MTNDLMELDRICKAFHKSETRLAVLDRVSLSVGEGDFLCIIGPSGRGKSTLLRIMAGLTDATSGIVKFHGSPLSGPHPKITMVFQTFALLPWKTVVENIELGLKLQGMPKKERRELSMKYVEMVGLRGFENNYPVELSGGMRQRVGFARALATDPEMILLDEAFSALDEFTANTLRAEIVRLWRETGKTFVMVTHSISEALQLSSRIIVMTARPGRMKESFEVDIPWPREKLSQEFAEREIRLFASLRDELTPSQNTGELGNSDGLKLLYNQENR